MRLDVLTLFPEVFAPLQHSIPARAQQAGQVELHLHQLRDWGKGKHRQVDDTPYGGGPGMVMACPPLFEAVRAIQAQVPEQPARVIYLSPQGPVLTQARILELSQFSRLLLICGHYEGIDERVIENLVDEEVSIGDYVLSGGELPAMVLADSLIRVLPDVIDAESVMQDSFYAGLLDHPHYTRPADFEGHKVPEVLAGGDHKKIDKWRREQALLRTRLRRPDLLAEPKD
jgi:tRNA (guanine37-N1)-methyltransferase